MDHGTCAAGQSLGLVSKEVLDRCALGLRNIKPSFLGDVRMAQEMPGFIDDVVCVAICCLAGKPVEERRRCGWYVEVFDRGFAHC